MNNTQNVPIAAVIFDMDGVLVDSEVYWQQSREDLGKELGKVWTPEDQRACMGVSTLEWAEMMRQRFGIDWTLDTIIEDIKGRMMTLYEEKMLLLPGAIEAVHTAASKYKVGLASGSATPLIQIVMQRTNLDQVFQAIVYGDDVPHGKPAPDIYLEAAKRLGVLPAQCVGIEDSANGIRSLKAAGMRVIAVPGVTFPLTPDVLQLADKVLLSLEAFSLDIVQALTQ